MSIKNSLKEKLSPWTKVKVKSLNKTPTDSIKQLKKNGKPKIYLLDLPGYGNLGDQAIAVAEVNFLKKYCKLYNYDLLLFNVEEFISNFRWYKKHIKKEDLILCQGGGNMSDEYDFLEDFRRVIIHEFKDNRIIVFPQTYFFSSKNKGVKSEKVGEKIYNSHKNLTLFAREKYSFEKMKKAYPNCDVYLVPDMVLNYPRKETKLKKKDKKKIIFCIRDDVERKIGSRFIENLTKFFIDKGYKVEFTDTITDKDFISDIKNAETVVDNKISQFSEAQVVLTDRLHGMLLTTLSNTNCIVFDNYNYKVKGVYEWVKNYKGIKFYKKDEDIKKNMNILSNIEYRYSPSDYAKYFESMAKVIFKSN